MFGAIVRACKAVAGKVALVAKGFDPRRSSKWPVKRKAKLKADPLCAFCRRKAKEVHHKIPFWFRPEWELDPENMQSVCRKCHHVICHVASDWSEWQDNVDEIAALCVAGIRGRDK